MPTLRESIVNRKNPENGYVERLRVLLDELEEVKRNAKKDIEAAIKEATDDTIFKDLEPAKKLAKDTAQAEILSFKGEVNELVKNILANIEQTKKDIFAKVDKDMDAAFSSFGKEMQKLLEASTQEMGSVMVNHNKQFTELSETVKTMCADSMEEAKEKMNRYAEKVETMRGPQGIQGIAGKDGKDGSPDTPQEIADKLNTTTDLVEMKVIKGLDQRLKSLQKAGKGSKGGGIGNTQHETKNVSSATTTVQTTYAIAGAGYAITAFYQGQFIARGTHYTVGSDFRTLTLLFTPDDSTAIDLVYTRG